MKAISWFSGIGGFDLALRRAGHEVVGACEIDESARRIYDQHFSPAWFPHDISEVTPDDIPKANVWTGGFPCQDTSAAGRRKGFSGERTGLVWTLLELASHALPDWIVLENVPGMFSVDGGRGFGELLARLDELGYMGAWRVLDAQHFGVPQRRRRVFIVACRPGVGCPEEVLALGESSRRDPAPRKPKRKDIAGTLEACANRTGGDRPPGSTVDTAASGYLVVGPLQAHSRRHGHAMTTQQAAESGQLVAAKTLTFVKRHRAANAQDYEKWTEGETAPTLNSFDLGDKRSTTLALSQNGSALRGAGGGRSGIPDPAYALGSRTGGARALNADTYVIQPADKSLGSGGLTAHRVDVAPPLTQGEARQDDRGVRVIYPKGDRTDVTEDARAINALRSKEGRWLGGSDCQLVHHNDVRRLTPVECERLQGFPDGWTCLCGGSGNDCSCRDGYRYRTLGNAVAVPVVQWLVNRLPR